MSEAISPRDVIITIKKDDKCGYKVIVKKDGEEEYRYEGAIPTELVNECIEDIKNKIESSNPSQKSLHRKTLKRSE